MGRTVLKHNNRTITTWKTQETLQTCPLASQNWSSKSGGPKKILTEEKQLERFIPWFPHADRPEVEWRWKDLQTTFFRKITELAAKVPTVSDLRGSKVGARL